MISKNQSIFELEYEAMKIANEGSCATFEGL